VKPSDTCHSATSQAATLLEPERRECVRRSGDERGAAAQAELTGEQVGAEEGERVGEEEQQVVADQGGVRPVADQPGRGVADEPVGEGERVLEGPELVRVEEVERLRRQRVPAPRDLPGLRKRIAQVPGHGLPQVQDERPVGDDRDQDRTRRDHDQLPRGDPAPGHRWTISSLIPSGS
jgi:hypothetical protein